MNKVFDFLTIGNVTNHYRHIRAVICFKQRCGCLPYKPRTIASTPFHFSPPKAILCDFRKSHTIESIKRQSVGKNPLRSLLKHFVGRIFEQRFRAFIPINDTA